MFTTGKKRGPKTKQSADERADKRRDSSREYQQNKIKVGQTLGDIPEVANWKRREACIADPELFLRTYFGQRPYFYTPFCSDHRKVIAKFEDAIRNGGLFALAMPRAHGKTSYARAFTIRAIATGMRRFAFFVGAASPHARRSIDAIKEMMVGSTLYHPEKKIYINPTPFAEDFPEIVFPAAALGRTPNRQKGQRGIDGVPTDIHWSGDHIRLPTLSPCPTMRPEQHRCGGSIAMGAGLLGSAITGLNINGLRPDLLIPDDPQTRESAAKDSACEKREEIINAMVTGLAGAGVRMAAVMPVTVIREGDLADRFLSHQLHPEWAKERTPLLHSMPTNMDLWEKNKAIRKDYNPYAGPEDKRRAAEEATLHYIDNQAAMDAGAEASWPERFNHDEVSAIQNAMNMHNDNRRAFFAEMQNKPEPPDYGKSTKLTADVITGKLSQLPRGTVPFEASTLTAFIDLQQTMLFYAVCAFTQGFSGSIIQYGTFPDQRRSYFTLSDAPTPLSRCEGVPQGEEAQIKWAIRKLTETLMTMEWPREKTGAPSKIDLCLVDSGKWTKIVYEVCRQLSSYKVLPSKGASYTSDSKKSTGSGKANAGDKRGYHWSLPVAKEERGVKLLTFDTNPWKSFLHQRLAISGDATGSMTLFGDDPSTHRMLADHLMAEYCEVNTNERTKLTVEEWYAKPGKPDNHWLDAVVGCCVAAAVQGVTLEGVHPPSKQRRNAPRLSIDDIKRRREAEQQKAGSKR